ncbi:MAG TPA: nitroreductase family protein [Clostridia bacterium]|nr:nitroreductase family protein [Clostridia bacterium]
MEFDEVIKTRRSIRKYKPEPVPEQYLFQLIEAAGLAPSALNLQPWRYVIVKDSAVIKRIAELTPNSFVANSPALILCCLDPKAFDAIPQVLAEMMKSGETLFPVEYEAFKQDNKDEAYYNALLHLNAGISFEHILLKATDLGLGACWIGMFDADSVKRLSGIDERYIIPALIAVGFPDQHPAAKPRLPIDEILIKTI